MVKTKGIRRMKYPARRMTTENLDWINWIFASEMSSKAKLVGSLLGSYMHGADEAYPGLSRLVYESSLSRRSVQNAIIELEREGWIVKKSGGVTNTGSLSPNHYQRVFAAGIERGKSYEAKDLIDADDPIANNAPAIANNVLPIATDAGGCGTECHTLVHPVAPNKIYNKIDNKIRSIDQKQANEKDSFFDDFWAMWPKKTAKEPARKAWRKISDKAAALELIRLNIEQHASAGDWSNPQYVPNPATYLNGERWNDTVYNREEPAPKYAGIEATLNNPYF